MDRTLTKILLARAKNEFDHPYLSTAVSDDQFGRWTAATVCACVDLEANYLSPRCTAMSMTSSPRHATERKTTGAILQSYACYADMFSKNCVDGVNFRYIPHNRMYIQCKTAARVRLADKRRKYGLGRQTARRAITKATVKQSYATPENRSQRNRLLPPLKQQETVPIGEQTRKNARERDVTVKTVTKSRDRDMSRKMAAKSTKGKQQQQQQQQRSTSVEEDDSEESESDDNRYDDDDDEYGNRYTCDMNIHKADRRYQADDSDSTEDKFSSSDESYSKPSRDRRHGDHKSSNSSLSVVANKLLKTSSYQFVPPGGVVSVDKTTSGNSLQRGSHALMSAEDRSSATYFSDDLAINIKPDKEHKQRRRRESHDTDSEYDIGHLKFNARDRRRSQSASPDWNRSSDLADNTSESRSEFSREPSDMKTTEWPINHTNTCLLADCRECRAARRVTGSNNSKDNRVTMAAATKARLKTDSCKLNLIGQTLSVGPGHRMTSLKMR